MSKQDIPTMKTPVQFLTVNPDTEKWEVCPEATKILSEIKQQLCVIAIAGKYRTGKSYLMNRLFDANKGFELGSTVQSHTKGIWMWAKPHPKDKSKCLLLLDTEGLHDVEKCDEQHDMQLFTLALLLSNCFVYNAIGSIDDIIIHQLQLVANLTEHVKTKKKQADDEETGNYFSKYFPSFFLVLRDFFLDLKIDGNQVSPDEYLEHALKLKPGRSKKVQEYNGPRDCIQAYFPKRRCYVLPKPVQDDKKIKYMENVSEAEINPEFLDKCHELVDTLHSETKPFTLEGNRVNGPRFEKIAQGYVSDFNDGAIPCIESTVDLMKNSECAKAMEAAFEIYTESMKKEMDAGMPMDSTKLTEAHRRSYDAAVTYYRDNSLFDEKGTFQQKLGHQIESAFQTHVHENDEFSREKSKAVLEKLFANISENINAGKYTKKGGYEEYKTEREKAIQEYRDTPGLGPMADKILTEFMQSRAGEEESIIKSDEALEEKEKELAKEQENVKRQEQSLRAAEQEQMQFLLQIERQERENEAMLTKLKDDFLLQQQQQQQKHEEDMLEKEIAYRKMIEEGQERYANQYQAILEEMREDKKRMAENMQEKAQAIDDFKQFTTAMLQEMKEERQAAQQQVHDSQRELLEAQKRETESIEAECRMKLQEADNRIRDLESKSKEQAAAVPYPYPYPYYPVYVRYY